MKHIFALTVLLLAMLARRSGPWATAKLWNFVVTGMLRCGISL